MRKLQNTLYVISDDLYLPLENNNVIVTRQKEVINRVPLSSHHCQNSRTIESSSGLPDLYTYILFLSQLMSM